MYLDNIVELILIFKDFQIYLQTHSLLNIELLFVVSVFKNRIFMYLFQFKYTNLTPFILAGFSIAKHIVLHLKNWFYYFLDIHSIYIIIF